MLSKLIAASLPLFPRPLVHRVAGRYIAGETVDAAVELGLKLHQKGFATTVDILGEDVTEQAAATDARNEYLELMQAMAAAGLERNVSLKLSAIGLRISEKRAWDELRHILERAAELDFFIRVDMEDSSVTDVTLDLYRRAREFWPKTGTVLQSRLRRTVQDAVALAREGANLRVCKGIYREPPELAFQQHEEINESFLECARTLLASDGYIGLATHDVPLIHALEELVAQKTGSKANHEFQALLGVPIATQLHRLRKDGQTVRIYVPFGTQWFAYSIRRLQENPKMAGAIAKSLFRSDHLEF